MIGKGPEGVGIRVHAKTHRQEFADQVGRQPDDYAEVRQVLDDRGSEQARFSSFEHASVDSGSPE